MMAEHDGWVHEQCLCFGGDTSLRGLRSAEFFWFNTVSKILAVRARPSSAVSPCETHQKELDRSAVRSICGCSALADRARRCDAAL